MIKDKIIKSVTIILERTSGEVLLCKRSKNVSFFPDFNVFPGGKLETNLPDDWIGDEQEVVLQGLQELLEEVGILAGGNFTIQPEERDNLDIDRLVSKSKQQAFIDKLQFVGRRQTPPFAPTIFDTAYYILSDSMVDEFVAIPDGGEIVEINWMLPSLAVELWENHQLNLPPPVLHVLRNLSKSRRYFEEKSLAESSLPIGLQTKVEFAVGVQAIPFVSNTIPPFKNTNLIVFESQGEYLIVDPGANSESSDYFKQYLQTLETAPKVFITHEHKDHWEGLETVQSMFPDSKVYGHSMTLGKVVTKLDKTGIEEGIISIGRKQIEVIYAPGHTSGHCILHDLSTNVVAAGDHVVGFGSAVLSPSNGDMTQYMKTCEKLIELNPRIIIPGHGPINFNPVKLLKNYIHHRLEREKSILEAIENGNNTLDEIVRYVYTDVPEEMWEFAKSNIVLHVRKLNQEEKTELIL